MALADVDIISRPYSHDPSALDAHGRRPVRDDLDDLFNYDAEVDNALNDVEDTAEKEAENARKRRLGSAEGDGLGIDEEVKIKKARAPQAKLDEERLLSQNGIPKLRTIVKTKVKFKGKGHEFSDVQRLLNTYQFWLDDLFPKAKFADGLAIIEKLGHKNRIKTMRQEWIDEDKPKPVHNPSDDDADFVSGDQNPQADTTDSLHIADANGNSRHDSGSGEAQGHSTLLTDNEMDDEFLYGLPKENETQTATTRPNGPIEEAPGEDELDLLLSEETMPKSNTFQTPQLGEGPSSDDFAEEEEAMAGLW